MPPASFLFAPLLTLCRAYNLAEAWHLSRPWQGSSPAQPRASSRPSRVYGHHLRPSTNCYTLSETRNPFTLTRKVHPMVGLPAPSRVLKQSRSRALVSRQGAQLHLSTPVF